MNLWALALISGLLIFSSCTESDKIRRDRLFIQGNEALGNRSYNQAIEYYSRAIRLDSSFASAYNNRGVARIEDGHPYEAIQDYDSAIRLDNEYWDAIFNRAYAFEQVGMINDALADIETVKSAFPDSAYVYFYEGLLHSRKKTYNQGIESFNKSIELDSTNLEAYVNLATTRYFMGEFDVAERILKQVLRRDPNQANALNTLSQIYLSSSDLQNALITINQALEVVPSEPYFLNNRGQVFLEMDSLNLALSDINRSIYLNPDNAWAYRNKGIYYLKQAQYDEAIRLLNDALGRNEFIDEVYSYLGQAYLGAGDRGKACEAWTEGVSQNEANSRSYLSQYCN